MRISLPLAVAIVILLTNAAFAQDVCSRAATKAAARMGVPEPLMQAITRVETGRSTKDGGVQPWPWTVNTGGPGHWFATRAEAEAFVTARLAEGLTNIDIGCFQLNHRWHNAAFADVSAMFDPQANAIYAARFLRDLYSSSGDWRAAAGDYHSRTPEKSEIYLTKLERVYLAAGGTPPQRSSTETPEPTPPRSRRKMTDLMQPRGSLIRRPVTPLIMLGRLK